MRNFEERLAEIGRRSQQIKKKRMMRNRVLALCVPLLLCLTLPLLAGVEWGKPTSAGAENFAAGTREELHLETQAAAGFVLSVQEIRVEGDNIRITHDDAETLEAVLGLLTKLTPIVPESTGTTYTATAPTYEVQWNGSENPAVAMEETGYRFFVVYEGGTDEYVLQGTMLKNVQTGQIYVLTERDCFDLKDALGIPLY